MMTIPFPKTAFGFESRRHSGLPSALVENKVLTSVLYVVKD